MRPRPARRRLARATAMALLLATCDRGVLDGQPELDALRGTVDGRVAAAGSPRAGRVIRESAPYLGAVRLHAAPVDRLPERVERADGFAWTTEAAVPPAEVVARITRATQIPVVLDIGLDGTRARMQAAAIRWRGPLSGFLDLLGSRWDAGWTYRQGIVRISDRIFRTYAVQASVARSSMSLETANAGAGSGSLATGVRLESAAWQEIDTNLAGIVDRGSYSLSPSAGLVSVTAPPAVHAAVAAYLDRANAIFATRIAIEVAAAFLDVSDLDDFGVSLEFLARLFDDGVSLRIGRDTSSRAAGIASFAILDTASGGLARHVDTSAMLHALARTHRVIDYRTANAITRHGSPVPIRLSRRQDIVRQVRVTVDGDSTTTAVEAETLDTGLSISAHPRLIEPGRVHLTLSIAASDLVRLVPFAAGEASQVQLATVDERRLTHDFVIGSDEMAILAGYEQQRAANLGEGVGTPEFLLLGGARQTASVRSRLYLFVSARTLQ